MAKILVFHPVTEQVAEITDHALPIVAASGWVLADEEGVPVPGWVAPPAFVDPDEPVPAEEPVATSDGPPEGTVHEILDWVQEDHDRAQAALEAEQAKDTPRISLVEPLQALLDTTTESQED